MYLSGNQNLSDLSDLIVIECDWLHLSDLSDLSDWCKLIKPGASTVSATSVDRSGIRDPNHAARRPISGGPPPWVCITET